jgi:hypothetical protein
VLSGEASSPVREAFWLRQSAAPLALPVANATVLSVRFAEKPVAQSGWTDAPHRFSGEARGLAKPERFALSEFIHCFHMLINLIYFFILN